MQTQFHLDELCADVMNMSLNDDEDGDVSSKGGGSSIEVAGSGTKIHCAYFFVILCSISVLCMICSMVRLYCI